MQAIQPGAIQESVSEFDSTKQLYMRPAFAWNSVMALGLMKSSKMKKDEYVLLVSLNRAEVVANPTLTIKTDRGLIKPKRLDSYGDISFDGALGINTTETGFSITEEELQQIIDSDTPVARFETQNRIYDGSLKYPREYSTPSPIESFKTFIARWKN